MSLELLLGHLKHPVSYQSFLKWDQLLGHVLLFREKLIVFTLPKKSYMTVQCSVGT